MDGKKTILYVDDEQINTILFELNFKKTFNIIVATSGVEALKIVKSQEIDLIVSDYKMPEMNGIELISEIKQIKPSVKCLIVSGFIGSISFDDSIKDMVSEFVLKPWEKEKFNAIILKWLN